MGTSDSHLPHSEASAEPPSAPGRRWRLNWRNLGLAGFLFFLIKGLLWLSVPFAIAAWRLLSS